MAHQGMLEQLPLFPWFGPGDIVPTAALSLTVPEMPRLHFYHYNDIPEVILCMAAEGGLIATGQLYLQQGTHGVTTFLRQPTGPEGRHYQISLIIVRMKPEGPQNEGFILRCCEVQRGRLPHGPRRLAGPRASLLSRARQRAPLRRRGRRLQPRAARVPKCGAAQPRFPVELMGWRRYAQYADAGQSGAA